MTQEEENFKETLSGYRSKFNESMDDDLNTADGLAVIFDMVRDINSNVKAESSRVLVKASYDMLMELLGVLELAL